MLIANVCPDFFISLQLVAMGTYRAMTFRPLWKVKEAS